MSGESFTLPQFGIFAQGTHAHHFLEFDLRPGISAADAVASFRRLRAPECRAGGVNVVIAFGAGRLARGRSVGRARRRWPTSARRRARTAAGRRRPSTTPGSGSAAATPTSPGITRARRSRAVDDVAVLAAEQPAFTYRDGRDLTASSTAPRTRRSGSRPTSHSSRPGMPGAGGSHVLAMRWVHDLEAFDRLPVAEQERVIGRTKPRQRRAVRRREAAHRPHRARHDRGGRRRARALPPERPVRHRRASTASTSSPSAPTRRGTTDAPRACSAPAGDGVRDRLTRLLAPGERRLLLRAVAQRPARARRARGRLAD